MKRFTEVTVQNFFNFAKEQTLSLSGNGVVNLQANNGYGKSALLVESFCFALYGKTRQAKIDDVVNRYIGKNCKVSVSFIGDNDSVYKIIRYRKHETHNNNVYLFKDNTDISSKNIKDTDAQIQELIGLPYIAFVNSMVFSSELFSNFFSAKNSERLVIFENILSLKEVTAFYLKAKDVLKELADKENEVKFLLSQRQGSVEEIQNSIQEYTNQARQKLLKLKARKEELKNKIAEAVKTLNELKELDVEKEKSKLGNSLLKEEYEKQITDKTNQLNALDSLVEPLEEKTLVEKYSNFDFNENAKKEAAYKVLQEEIRKRESGRENLKAQLSGLDSSISSLTKEKAGYDVELKKIEENLSKLSSSICPFCGQEMGKEETEAKRKELENNKNTLINSLAEVDSELNEKNLTFEDIQKELKNLSDDVISMKNKMDNNFVSNTELIYEKFLNAKKTVEDYNKEFALNSEKKQILLKEREELVSKSSRLDISKYSKEYLDSISSNIESQENLLADYNKELSAIDGSVSGVYDKVFVENKKNQLAQKTKEVDVAKNSLSEITEDEKYYNYLADCFSNKSGGFKKYFINEMIPVFVEKLNQYLPFFFNDREINIELDLDLNDSIKVDGKEVQFSSFSRGQKTRLEIAAALALFGVSRIFFNNESGLLVVDEILDEGLDAFGVRAAIEILKSFGEDSKVFVVSHNQETKDLIDETIEIQLDENGFANIKA